MKFPLYSQATISPKRTAIHLFGWILVLPLLPLINLIPAYSGQNGDVLFAFSIVGLSYLFYFYIIPQLLDKKRWPYAIAWMFVGLVSFLGVNEFMASNLFLSPEKLALWGSVIFHEHPQFVQGSSNFWIDVFWGVGVACLMAAIFHMIEAKGPFPKKAGKKYGKEYLVHLIGWFLVIAFLIGTKILRPRIYEFGEPLLLIPIIVLAYLLYFHWIPQFLNARKWDYFVQYLILAYLGFTAFNILISLGKIDTWDQGELADTSIWIRLAFYSLVYFILACFLGGMLRFTRDFWYKERLEKQFTATQLDLLRAQINPHFLFNTLNNIYALALEEESPKTAGGIARLSYMMRHMLTESREGMVSVEKEWAYIEHYLQLQKLRLPENGMIDLTYTFDGESGGLGIMPMLLIVIIENACKHGISMHEPSFVYIDARIEEDIFYLSVKNSCHNNTTDNLEKSSGIGLKNLRERLNMLYPHSHSLSINETKNQFDVQLSLNLQKETHT